MKLFNSVVSLFVIFLSTALLAQTAGSISGVVSDPSGAFVQAARITATNQATGAVRGVETNTSGYYSLTNVVPGTYSVKVEKQGFQTINFENTPVTVAQALVLNAKFAVGAVQESIEVNGAAIAPIETESSQLSTLVDHKTIVDLPLLTRNPYELILLSPGTNSNVDFVGGISVNGSRDRNNNFLLDGVDNNDTSVPGGPAGVLSINPDSTQEFRIITDTFNAEYGRNTGAIIDVVTRSGSNEFHGDAYEFGRYNALGARDFFNRAPARMNPYVRNQFGGSVGGPILKNRTFFFINGEYQRFRTTLTNTTTLPTKEFKSGLFTTNGQTIDLRTPGGQNNLSGLSVDPTITKIFNLLPNPPSGNVLDGISGTYHFASPDALNGYEWVGKIDQKITDKHQLTLRYAYNHSNESDQGHTEFAPGIDTLAVPAYAHGVFAGLVSTINNHLINDFKFGLNRVFAAFDSNCASILDPITGVDAKGFGRDFTSPDLALGVGPFAAIGCNTLAYSKGQGRHTGTTSYTDTLTWVKGNHTMKFGGDFRDVTSSGDTNFLSRDNLDFNRFSAFGAPSVNLSASVPPQEVTSIEDLAWMLVGGTAFQVQAQFFNKGGVRQPSDNKHFVQHEYDAFFQDSWKLRRNLTLSLGLRYQFDGVPFETGGNFSNLFQNADSFASSLTFTVVGPGNSKRDMYKNDYKNFEPRIGFAWDPWGDGKTSIRAAYGIFHDRIFDNLFGNARGNPPFQRQVQNPFAAQPVSPANIPFAATTPPGLVYQNGDYAAATLLANNIRMPMSQSWNFGIQRDLGQGFVLSTTYVGNHSTRVIRSLDAAPPDPVLVQQAIADCVANDPGLCQPGDPTGVVSGPSLYLGVTDPVTGIQVAPPSVRQTAIQTPGIFSNSITLTNGSSNYNSLQVQLQKSAYHNLQFALAYTYSHAIDNSNDPLNSIQSGFGTFPLDSRHADTVMRGNSDNDLRHRFTANFSYAFPFGRGQAYVNNGILGRALEGIELSGIVTLQSGHPYTVFVPGVDYGRTGASVAVGASWPNVVGDPYANSGPRIDPNNGVATGAVNSNAFTTSIPAFGTLGNAGRNGLVGPSFYETNIALMKNVRITERFRLQLRGEAFNLFNRPEFQQPGGVVGSGTLGRSTATVVRSDFTTSNRQIQLALKLTF